MRPYLILSLVALFIGQHCIVPSVRADELADNLQNWRTLETKGDYRGALVAANVALAASIKANGRESDETIRVMSEVTRMRFECGDYKGARESGMQALALHEKLHPEKLSAVTALTGFYLGRLETIYRDFPLARQWIEGSLQYFEQHEPGHPSLSYVLREYAFFLSEDSESKPSITTGKRALELATKRFGKDDPETALCRERLGFAFFRAGELSTAETELKAAIDSLTESLGKDHPHVGLAVYHLSWLSSDMGRRDETLTLLAEAQRIFVRAFGDEHIHTSYAASDTANNLRERGEFATLKTTYASSIEVRQKIFGNSHPQLINPMMGLADVYSKQGNRERTTVFLKEAERMALKYYGPDHERTGNMRNGAGHALIAIGDLEAALASLQDGLRIAENKRGPSHPMTINARQNVAWTLNRLGRHAEADNLYAKAAVQAEATYGTGHRYALTMLWAYGTRLLDRGELPRAKKMYEEALKQAEKKHPSGAFELVECRKYLAEIWLREQQWPEAIAAMDESRRAQKGAAAQAVLGMTESEVLSYLSGKLNDGALTPITLATERGSDQTAIDTSASWHLNRKAMRWAVLGERTQLTRQVSDPATKELREQLAGVREKLAAAMFQPTSLTLTSLLGAPTVSEYSKLSQEADLLTAKLARAAGATSTSTKWIELDEIRKFIPKRAVLIEFSHELRFIQGRPEGAKMPYEFGAWIIPAEDAGEIRFVNLGGIVPILEGIEQARWAIQASVGAFIKEPEKTESQLKQILTSLSEKLFAPLETHLKDCDHLIISPDGQLWTVPWSTLITADKKYAVEKYTITLVASGRDLLRAPRNEQLKSAVVFADPEYNAGAKGEDVSAEFTRLPGSAREAKEITPVLKKLVGAEPRILIAKEATESAVKETREASILVLSTHGFFQPISANSRINPYLCCGLAFRGANQKSAIPTSNDGLLTGLEILNLDLTHTQLVVLSACNSGVGQVQRGDGVSGLVQAFQLAGAESVLASLWPVADEETATLVSHFFQEYSELKTETPAREATALRQAQLAMIKAQRKKQKATHPFFWSAFTLNAATH